MTNSRTSTGVVAATDGSRGSHAAIGYAALEAGARGLPLEIVTVMPAYLPAGPFPVGPDASMRRAAHTLLDEGLAVARATAPDLEVTTTLVLGSRVDTLVHHTRDAALLALGAPERGLAERLWTGSIVCGTAARVRCPLVVVPPDPAVPRRHLGRIVVGLKASQRAEHLLGSAFAVARHTQSDLVVVHAWRMLSGYDDAIAARTTGPERVTELVRSVEDSMADLRMAYPGVQVQVEVVQGPAAPALVTRSAEADLLLVSRPAHGGFAHPLGATARAVIREATCPVEVVPPTAETSAHKGHVDHPDTATALV